ncbi:endonuclease/exonuclease/phosphatase family protein [Vibrio sp. TH_r3]|uniref:endonuclease/exonuclease/phosphatase family protein n=1 Tax=Vibrio sp. TH_r3 TaxID=3082084 RepID=UPI00295515F2|nr:endonuclease/exonuclease/phosphatase family protein [Vibrio sp. TH_r3]MDV7105052.1 endonuclease/exonuclease/phosphatase family protein [Vibrio sp. TH_r3]
MKPFIKKLLTVYFLLAVLGLLLFKLIFDVPQQPLQFVIGSNQDSLIPFCYHNASPEPVDKNGQLNLLVWNIYKQNRSNWNKALDAFSQDAQLLLLQEASLSDEFKSWIKKQEWDSNYLQAFSAFKTSAGVVNLANQFPTTACGYRVMEPWLQLPKSGLYAEYLLSNGQTLAVVNIHAINFTLGTKDYQQQIQVFKQNLLLHSGPIIVAGDFNTWSEDRLASLRQQLDVLQLTEVNFIPDNRKRFLNGMPLDHVFYKRLTLISAEAPITDASDHNPLLVSFALNN